MLDAPPRWNEEESWSSVPVVNLVGFGDFFNAVITPHSLFQREARELFIIRILSRKDFLSSDSQDRSRI